MSDLTDPRIEAWKDVLRAFSVDHDHPQGWRESTVSDCVAALAAASLPADPPDFWRDKAKQIRGERDEAEREVARLRAALTELERRLKQMKVDAESVTVDAPVSVMPNLVAHHTAGMRAYIDAALGEVVDTPQPVEGPEWKRLLESAADPETPLRDMSERQRVFTCATCGALPGESCLTSSGRYASPHVARIRAENDAWKRAADPETP